MAMSTCDEEHVEAAVSSLAEYGFNERLVRRTLRDLRRVYGGEGWSFIQENNYELVVETIITDQESRGNQDSCFKKQGFCGTSNRWNGSDTTPNDILDKQHNRNIHVGNTAVEEGHCPQLPESLSDIERSEICLHQQNLWKQHGVLSLPSWLSVSHAPRYGQEQKYVLLNAPVKRHSCNQNQLQLVNAYDLDPGRMSAFKLRRRRDGCPNPMFSRLQKYKDRMKGCVTEESQFAEIDTKILENMEMELDVYESASIRNGFQGKTSGIINCMRVESYRREEINPEMVAETANAMSEFVASSSECGPVFPPGFEAVGTSSDIPPGFWGHSVERNDIQKLQTTPDLPPGVWRPLEQNCPGFRKSPMEGLQDCGIRS